MTNEQKIEDLFKSGDIELAVILMINNPIDNLYDLMDAWIPVKEPARLHFGRLLTEWTYILNQDWNVTIVTSSFRDMTKFYLNYKSMVLFSQINTGTFSSYTKKKYLIKLIKSYVEHEGLE
tara:strand:- start:817 stop:1179 length:363 start_codon:yes stop_codon:yes gene_type:complete